MKHRNKTDIIGHILEVVNSACVNGLTKLDFNIHHTHEPLFVLLSHIFSVYKFSFTYNRSYAYLIQSDEAVIADETLVSLKN